jgi:uncharacterized repeat protein (TIGR01451 family)
MNATLRKQLTGLMMAMGLIINLIALPIFASSHLAPSNVVNKSRAASQTARSTTQPAAPASIQKTEARASEVYGKLPISFEANRGQTDPSVRFLARGSGYNLFLTPTEAVLNLRKDLRCAKSHEAQAGRGNKSSLFSPASSLTSTLRMKLVGANGEAQITGEEQLPGRINYFTGRDAANWKTNVVNYAKVRYQDIYPGVDMVYYGNQRELEYDFALAPGTDPGVIKLAFAGAQRIWIDRNGELVLKTPSGEIHQHQPVAYQEVDGTRQVVAARYALKHGQVGFEVGNYDASKPLVIDPVVAYSTFLGGSGDDYALDIAVDASGNAYVVGQTQAISFPITSGAAQSVFGGGNHDLFVAKLNSTGSALIYSTYLGGNSNEYVRKMALDSSGCVYLTGETSSTDFPVTPGAYRSTLSSDTDDVFVTKLDATGSALIYSTYIGSPMREVGSSIAVDAGGNAYITGEAYGGNYPTTPGAFQPTFSGNPFNYASKAFVTKLNATGSALVYSTYLSGLGLGYGNDIAVDSSGNAYVVGEADSADFPVTPGAFQTTFGGLSDGFVTKLNATGSALLYSTYIGGNGADKCRGIALDATGRAYVAGQTTAYSPANFPTTPGAYQSTPSSVFPSNNHTFVTKFSANGDALEYSLLLTSDIYVAANEIAIDSSGNAYVAGYEFSNTFPRTADEIPTPSGAYHAFVSKFDTTGSTLLSSTRFGVNTDGALGLALDSAGNAYITGYAYGPDFPTTPGAFQTTHGGSADAFIAKLDYSPKPSDVSIAMSAQPEVETNATLDYNITVANNGPYQATGVSVTDVFPAGATLTSVNVSQGSCTQSDVGGITSLTCSLGSLSASTTASLSFGVNANVPAGSTLQNAASVSSSSPDPNSANNSATATTNVTANFNTHAGVNSNVQLGGVSLTFNQVFGAGNTTATAIDPATAGQLPGDYLLNSNSFAYEITTTATYSAPITVCFDASAATNDPAEFSNLRILHGEGGVLVDRTILPPDSPAPDFGTKTICASVSSLSPFVLARKGTLYKVRALFDQTTAYKSGSTIPIKLQLTNANGVNVSSASIVVTALSVVRVSTNTSGAVTDAGNANPDSNFRYDGGGYAFNLKTKGYASGTYLLRFKAGNDSSIYSLQFQVR